LRYAEYQRVSKRRPMPGYNNSVYDNTHAREPDTTTAQGNSRPNGETRSRADTSTQSMSISRSPVPPPQTSPPNHPPPPVPGPGPSYSVGASTSTAPIAGVDRSTTASSSRRVSQPLPNTPYGGEGSRVPAKAPTPPPQGTQQPNRILFYGEQFRVSYIRETDVIKQSKLSTITRLPSRKSLISKRGM